MTVNIYENFAGALTAQSIAETTAVTSVNLVDGSSLPSPSSGEHVVIVVTDSTDTSRKEIMWITNRNGNVITLARGKEGTTPISFPMNALVECRLTAEVFKKSNIFYIDPMTHGAIGDGNLHTLQEWIDCGKYSSLLDIKTKFPRANALTDSIDWLAIQTALDEAASLGVQCITPGKRFVINKTLWNTTWWSGAGPLAAWRPAPFSDFKPENYDYRIGTELLYVGTGEKVHSTQFVTSSHQCGFHRENLARAYNNEFDQYFEPMDLTNRDASGTTPATSKLFSCAVVMGSGLTAYRPVSCIEKIRIITSCPGDGETYGIKGYADQVAIRPWAHWDIGVWSKSPWRSKIQDCQIIGYWDIRGHLMTTFDISSTGIVPGGGGFAEFYKLKRTLIQGGTSFRSGDIWPVVAKTDTSIAVQWTSSHQFPSSGLLNITSTNRNYTGTQYDAANNWLWFTGIVDTSFVVVNNDEGTRSVVRTQQSGGAANTTIEDCELCDFAHSTRVEEQGPDFAPYQMPIRASFECSGHPLRGIAISDTLMYGTSPSALHFGNARDIEFYSCYFEPKSYKTALGGNSQTPGAVFIMGPSKDYFDKIPTYDRGRCESYGDAFVSNVNMEPWINVASTSRMAAMKDCFNPRYYHSPQRNTIGGDGFFYITSFKGQKIALRSRDENNGAHDALTVNADGSLLLGEGPTFTAENILQGRNWSFAGDNVLQRFKSTYSAKHQFSTFSWELYGASGNFYLRNYNADDYSQRNDLMLWSPRVDGKVDFLLTAAKIDMRSLEEVFIRAGADNLYVRMYSGSSLTVAANTTEVLFNVDTSIRPGTDNMVSNGLPNRRWSVVYAFTGAINVSDARRKTDPEGIPNLVLKAWGEVAWCQFKYKDSVSSKGDGARIHTGLIAQDVKLQLEKKGIDPTSYGVFCYDSWEAREEILSAQGELIQDAMEAGDVYGIRYDEAFALEAAYVRSEITGIKERLTNIENRVTTIETLLEGIV